MDGKENGSGCADLAHGRGVRHNDVDADSLKIMDGATGACEKNATLLPALIGVKEVAATLSMSERSVWRLSDAGKLPAPVRIGRMVRWSRSDIMQWVNDGCPAIRTWRRTG